jgi:hypothetical protein
MSGKEDVRSRVPDAELSARSHYVLDEAAPAVRILFEPSPCSLLAEGSKVAGATIDH